LIEKVRRFLFNDTVCAGFTVFDESFLQAEKIKRKTKNDRKRQFLFISEQVESKLTKLKRLMQEK